MRIIITLLFIFYIGNTIAQNKNYISKKVEDSHGHLITDPAELQSYFKKKERFLDSIQKKYNRLASPQIAVPLCSNGSFEEFETISGINVLKDYRFSVGEPLNPMQCQSVSTTSNQIIKQYDPAIIDDMASTVPANFLDEYIGNIKAFDQFALRINYKHTGSQTLSVVQAKRFKTNNETTVKFNFKTVLQTIEGQDHLNEQPYFKARVVSSSGNVVSEFCLIGDTENCIFSKAPYLEGGSVILYNPNWQSGILDITSIPNNEEFTIEFMTAICGLSGHFGYAYVDDICTLHTDENLQGSIELDPIYKICPILPITICGSFTIPNSGGISATVTSIELNIRNESNAIIYTSKKPATLDLALKRFCFELKEADFPDIIKAGYNAEATISYGLLQTNCAGTNFTLINDDDANPGWDIWFLNCTDCDLNLQTTTITKCDSNQNGMEFFNLSNLNTLITSNVSGLTFSYFKTLSEATNDNNPIANFTNYESRTITIYIRVTKSATCYKIIPVDLIVRNPRATISGILNVCSGSTTLTASSGSSYQWGTGEKTQSIAVNAIGTYTTTVTDSFGCDAVGTVTILKNLVAVQPTIVVTQPTCFVNTGVIEIASPASEYSYDGGVTWVANSVLSNVSIGNYKIKIRTAAGCTSFDTTIGIIPFLSSFPDYSAINPKFCGDIGSITITTLASSYSFDDGLTWLTDNTITNLPSGTYKIRVKDSFGCISNFNSVVLNGEFLKDPIYIANNPYCGILGSIEITTPAIEFSFDGGITWQTSNVLNNLTNGSYILKIKDAQGCTSSNVYVYLNNLEDNYPKYTIANAGCGTYASITITTPADAYSFDGGTTWTPNPLLDNLLGSSNHTIKVRKDPNCFSLSSTIYIYSKYLPLPEPVDYETRLCDVFNDGSENVDLTFYNSNIIPNSSAFTFKYFKTRADAEDINSFNQIQNAASCKLSNSDNTVFVRVISRDNCYQVAQLKFTFIDSPRIKMQDSYPLCEFKNVYIDAKVGFTSYFWSTQKTTQVVSIRYPGDYWVTVTEDNGGLICSSTKNFNIFLSNPAKIEKITASDWTNSENIIKIYVTGLGIYEYSLDGIKYQDSNAFYNLENGVYQVYIRDKYNCGVVKEETYLLMYPKFFTPNGDGSNDTWKIKFSEYEKGLLIRIFNRDGKFVKELNQDTGWDGTLNGKALPSTDYWFVVTRANSKEYRGHFSLKR